MDLKTCVRCVLFLFLIASTQTVSAQSYLYCDRTSTPVYKYDWLNNFMCDVKRDYTNFYSTNNLLVFGNYFIAAGILANTTLDQSIARFWQTQIRNRRSDAFYQPFNTIGSFTYQQLSVYILALSFGYWRDRSVAADIFYTWSYRNIRSFLVGVIPQVVVAKSLGAGRPSLDQPSKWQPFKYSASVSGHTFWGATPFLTAAMMVEEPIAKAALYTVSIFPGLARINSNAHYTSQVLLGWSLAYLSAKAVYNSDMQCGQGWNVSVIPKEDGLMLAANWKF